MQYPIVSRRSFIASGAMIPVIASMPAPARSDPARPIPPRPFRLAIPDATLQRIAARLADVQLPRRVRGTGWKYGVDAQWFDSMLAYWRSGYDWRAQERAINALPQFTATVMGKQLHFVHQRSANPAARPLVLLHGWPYSFWSFSKVIAPLAQDFHVIVPSLPGSIFSEPVADAPSGLRAVSKHIHALMTETLGYRRYFVQGSDHGAVIADWLALDQQPAILGEHTNLIAFRHQGAEYASGTTGLARPTAAESRFVKDEVDIFKKESAYFELQRTRPETIAYALSDSPVGAAAYVWDKWQKWTDTRARSLEAIYGRDRLLTELMLYIVTDSLATAIWPYAGFEQDPFSVPKGRTIDVPFGFSGHPDPLNAPPPREFAAHSRSRIVHWNVAETGGHFPFLEDPAHFVASVRKFGAAVPG